MTRGDLLAEVERAAARELVLVGVVDGGELGQPEDLEGGAVDDVGRREGVDPRVVVARRTSSRPLARPGAGDRAARLAVGGLRRRRRVVVGRLAACLGALVRAHPGVRAADLAERLEVALRREPSRGGLEAAVALLEDAPLLGDEGVEVVGRDQLVLGPVDELDEVRRAPSSTGSGRRAAGPARMSRSSSTWPTPSSTSGRGGSPASAAFSVRIRWQKLWKFETVIRARVAVPTVSSSRSCSSRAAFTL